jgi:hypothetical protein
MGVFVGAVLIAAPLAALTLTPGSAERTHAANNKALFTDTSKPYYGTDVSGSDVPADLPHLIADGVSTSVQTAVAAVAPQVARNAVDDFETVSPSGASVKRVNGVTVARSPSGATVTVYPPDASGRSRVVARSQTGATAVSYVDADDVEDVTGVRMETRHRSGSVIDQAIDMKAVGVTPAYVAAIRAVSPALSRADLDDIVGMKALGVTPQYVRDLASAGLGNLSAEQVTQARATGVDPAYVRAMNAAGFRGNLEDYVEMRAVGITPDFANQFRKSGYKVRDADQLVKLKVHGITAETLRNVPPAPPRPPKPPQDDPDGG